MHTMHSPKHLCIHRNATRYKDAKLEAKKVVRNAKNEEWTQLGKELEKDARGNQRKFGLG